VRTETETENGPAVVVRVEGRAGHITLNRPEALNALTLDMVRLIDAALDRFQGDPAVTTVVIDGAGDRALCAGGDIVSIYEAARSGDPSPRTFWAEEYRLNARIARFPKPVVAVMDGIVMGGGVGLSAHASHRVVTERSAVAMPEVGIGFAPDVGGTWLLARAPGEVGTHLALTAGRVGAADAIFCGLADHHVPSAALDELVRGLRWDDADTVIGGLASEPAAGRLAAGRSWIDQAYGADTVTAVVERLRAGGPDAVAAADRIEANSPTAVKVALRALRTARTLASLEAALEMEHRISSTFLDTADFVEGVRAAVIDKDRTPKWDPAALADVADTDVDRFFVPRPDDLHLDPAKAAR
jgi:enoyl-CoA hydratase